MASKIAQIDSISDARPITAADVLNVIEDNMCRSNRAILLREFPLAPGTRGRSKYRIDGLLVRTQGGRPDEFTAIEVKVCRKDFERELADPEKRARAMQYVHAFYFAVPSGLVHPHEVPKECGLMWTGKSGAPCMVKYIRPRTPEPPPTVMIRDLVRAAHRKGLHDAAQEHRLTAWTEIDMMGECLSILSEGFGSDEPYSEYLTEVLNDVYRELGRQGRPDEALRMRQHLNAARANAGKLLAISDESD